LREEPQPIVAALAAEVRAEHRLAVGDPVADGAQPHERRDGNRVARHAHAGVAELRDGRLELVSEMDAFCGISHWATVAAWEKRRRRTICSGIGPDKRRTQVIRTG